MTYFLKKFMRKEKIITISTVFYIYNKSGVKILLKIILKAPINNTFFLEL